MEYALLINNREYPLPPKTIDIQEKIDKIDEENEKKLISKRKKYENMFTFVKELVGEEAAKEIYETDDVSRIDKIDLCTITISYLGVVRAYEKAIQNFQTEDVSKGVSEIFNDAELGKIISLANSMEKISKTVNQGK